MGYFPCPVCGDVRKHGDYAAELLEGEEYVGIEWHVPACIKCDDPSYFEPDDPDYSEADARVAGDPEAERALSADRRRRQHVCLLCLEDPDNPPAWPPETERQTA